jgi:hypothetical protein
MHEQRDAVRKGDEPEGEELVQSNRLAVNAPQIDDELPDTGPAESSHAKARGYRPQKVHGEPAPAVRAKLVSPHQPETQHHEREGSTVVQSGLSGETEANRFGVVLV